MVAAVALTGVGAGLSVLVAQSPPAEQQRLLRRTLVLGLAVSAPAAAAAALGGWQLSAALGGGELPRGIFVLAALAGWLSVLHGLVNGFWLGQQRRGSMLALAAACATTALAAAALAPRSLLLEALVVSQALPAVVALVALADGAKSRVPGDRAIERYLLPGVVIGVFSPLSMIAVRSLVADALSWHDSGVLQALWRIADWVCGLAAGVLSVLYLPRFAAAHPRPGLGPALREAVKTVLLPCALLFALLFAFHRPLLEALYDPSFRAPPLAVALLFAGSLARIAAWIALFGLYAARRTRAIAAGEVLSLPLFAALVFAAGGDLTLEAVGLFWLGAFLCYAAFNFWRCADR
jgi:PST family polysaccharide transporter